MLGLGCASLSLLVMTWGMKLIPVGSQLSFNWVILFIIIMEIGELFLVPASKALVGDLIPERFQGLCTGINQMSIGISVMISGYISELYLIHENSTTKNALTFNYENHIGIFENLAIIALIFLMALQLCDRFLKKRDNLLTK
jgi:dipeptide/tripeptide permease